MLNIYSKSNLIVIRQIQLILKWLMTIANDSFLSCISQVIHLMHNRTMNNILLNFINFNLHRAQQAFLLLSFLRSLFSPSTSNQNLPQFISYTLNHALAYIILIPFLTCSENNSMYPYIASITPPLQASNIFTAPWSFFSQSLMGAMCTNQLFTLWNVYHN